MLISIFAFFLASLIIAEEKDLFPLVVLDDTTNMMKYFYFKPWTRGLPSLIGVKFGAFYRD